MVERAVFDFGSLCVMIFCFYDFSFVLFYNNISRLEEGKLNFTTICNFDFFFFCE